MTTGSLFRRFASDEDLAPLLAEPELAFLKERPADSELSKDDIVAVITFCDHVEQVLENENKILTKFEGELETLDSE